MEDRNVRREVMGIEGKERGIERKGRVMEREVKYEKEKRKG